MSEQQPDPVDMDTLTFTDEAVHDVPPPATPSTVMVPRSVRVPFDLDRWVTATAQRRGVKESDLLRDLLVLGRSAFEQYDHPVSLADVLSALVAVRPRDAA